MIRIAIAGAGGRMGRELVNAARSADGVTLTAGLVRPGSPLVGTDLGRTTGGEPLGVAATDDTAAALVPADVLIDFSPAAAAVEHARAAAAAGRAILVGTTGLGEEQRRVLTTEVAAAVPVLLSANASPGINALLRLLPALAAALGPGYDVEVVETHHRHKRDAPSGTALALAARLVEATGGGQGRLVFGRAGEAPRRPGEIGVLARRAGGIPGEHRILFASEGESVEIAHVAFSRRTYADGALRAACWLVKQPAGFYTHEDVAAGG